MTDTAKLVAKVETKGVKKATDELDKLGKQAKKTESRTSKMSKAAKASAKAFAAGAAAFGGAAIAIGAVAAKVAEAEKQWRFMAQVSGDTVANFKASAFAAEQFGISAEKLGDISKDTKEKLGEFIATGGGGFKDFFEQVAPKVGLTAKELEHLSGTEVLQKVKNAMDEANVPMSQQSFYLESIASDTTALIPLLKEEGAALNSLTSRYKGFNDGLQLSASEQGGLAQVSASFNLMGDTASNALSFIVGSLAPEFETAIDAMTSSIQGAAQSFVFFVKSVQDGTAENIQTKILDNMEMITTLEKVYSNNASESIAERISDLKSENIEMGKKLTLLHQTEKAENEKAKASQFVPTKATAGSGNVIDFQVEADKRAAEEKARQDKIEADKSLAREKELMDHRFSLANEYRSRELEAELEYSIAVEEEEERRNQAILESRQLVLSGASDLFGSLAELQSTFGNEQGKAYKALFAASKAFSIAESIMSIQTGIAKAQELGWPANIPAMASVIASTAGVISTISSTQFSPRAQGGQTSGLHMVGEHGREIVNLGSGGRIASNSETERIMGGNSAPQVVINNYASGTKAEAKTMDDGRVVVIVKEVLRSEILSPNSQFNKDFSATRKSQRQF